MKAGRHQIIAEAKDIDQEAARVISDKIERSPEENIMLHKYHLRTIYNWTDEITPGWVRQYDDPATIKQYRSLRAIVDKGLEVIRQSEVSRFETNSNNPDDWNKQYHYDKHRVANEFITICGFTGIQDTTIVTRNQLVNNIIARKDHINNNYDHTRVMFKLRGKKPIVTQQNIRPVIDYINSVLAIQYGIKISVEGKGKLSSQRFKIKHHHPLDESLRPKKLH